MDIDRATREEMNALSKEVFGVSSKWQKMLKEGYKELVTKIVSEEIPGENGAEATTKESKVPVLTSYGAKQSVVKYHTLESLKALIISYKEKRDAYIAEYKRKQEEEAKAQEAARLAKAIHDQVGGTAV